MLNPSNYLENWFKYRLPNDDHPICGSSPRLEKGVGNGFVFAPFSNPRKGIFTIPEGKCPPGFKFTPADSPLPYTTERDDYFNEVDTIIDDLAGTDGKVVAARVIRVDTTIDLDNTFNALEKAFPDAFVFMFSTTLHGTWIGASPELLLCCHGNSVSTMALAGTRPKDSTEPWDEKNIREQQLVTEFIVDCLNKYSSVVSTSPKQDRKAGAVEHICTPIYAQLRELSRFSPVSWPTRISNILCDLSPTPALCGSDRRNALRLIKSLETFSRELYGGFCGPCDKSGYAEFYVNLRSAKCTPDAVAVYVGGGITPQSDPESEWTETELKSNTILSNLISTK